MSLYSYKQVESKECQTTSSEDFEKYVVERISFSSSYDTNVEEVKMIHVFLHTSRNPKAKLLFLHGLGNRNLSYLMWFAKHFASHDLATVFMVMPYNAIRASADLAAGKYYMEAILDLFKMRFRLGGQNDHFHDQSNSCEGRYRMYRESKTLSELDSESRFTLLVAWRS